MSSVRRVAVISYHSSPLVEPGSGDAGGMTVYVRELAKALANEGLATDIYTRSDTGRRDVTVLDAGTRVISIEAGPNGEVSKDLLHGHIEEFVDGIRSFTIGQHARYDLVHSHYWQSGLAGARLAAAWGVPFVHSNHTLGRVKNRWLAPGDAPEPSSRLDGEHEVMEAADVLIASTRHEARELSLLYGASPERLKVLHPGVDHDRFQPGSRSAARADLGLGAGPLLLCVGRIQRLKGMDLAIEVVARRAHDHPQPPRLLIVGGAGVRDGAEERRLRDLADQLGVAKLVNFVGQRPHAELPLYYRASDALLVCSHSESFGLAAIEAQACGRPVVATAVGGLASVVSHGRSGQLLPTRDPDAFARAVSDVIDDADRWRLFGAEAREHALRFSWKKTAEGFLELYECLLRETFPEACTC